MTTKTNINNNSPSKNTKRKCADWPFVVFTLERETEEHLCLEFIHLFVLSKFRNVVFILCSFRCRENQTEWSKWKEWGTLIVNIPRSGYLLFNNEINLRHFEIYFDEDSPNTTVWIIFEIKYPISTLVTVQSVWLDRGPPPVPSPPSLRSRDRKCLKTSYLWIRYD